MDIISGLLRLSVKSVSESYQLEVSTISDKLTRQLGYSRDELVTAITTYMTAETPYNDSDLWTRIVSVRPDAIDDINLAMRYFQEFDKIKEKELGKMDFFKVDYLITALLLALGDGTAMKLEDIELIAFRDFLDKAVVTTSSLSDALNMALSNGFVDKTKHGWYKRTPSGEIYLGDFAHSALYDLRNRKHGYILTDKAVERLDALL